MKKLIFLALLLISVSAKAQETEAKNSPEQLVKDFFIAFHAQDIDRLKNFGLAETRLTSVSTDSTGATELSTTDYLDFIKNIAAIPETATFEEKLHAFRVEENGLLAMVTTPYSFYYNEKLAHCGVNSFQLVKFDEHWKIVYILDTRTKDNCD